MYTNPTLPLDSHSKSLGIAEGYADLEKAIREFPEGLGIETAIEYLPFYFPVRAHLLMAYEELAANLPNGELGEKAEQRYIASFRCELAGRLAAKLYRMNAPEFDPANFIANAITA